MFRHGVTEEWLIDEECLRVVSEEAQPGTRAFGLAGLRKFESLGQRPRAPCGRALSQSVPAQSEMPVRAQAPHKKRKVEVSSKQTYKYVSVSEIRPVFEAQSESGLIEGMSVVPCLCATFQVPILMHASPPPRPDRSAQSTHHQVQ